MDNIDIPSARPRNVVIDMEEIGTNQYYALSYNPIDSHQYFDENSIRRQHTFKDAMVSLFSKHVGPFASYQMNIELKTRLHLHGIISFPDDEHITRFYLRSLHVMLEHGTWVMKPIDHSDIWTQYCTKQRKMWDSIKFDPVFDHILSNDIIMSEDKSARQELKDNLDDAIEYGIPILSKNIEIVKVTTKSPKARTIRR